MEVGRVDPWRPVFVDLLGALTPPWLTYTPTRR
jgi:hypothetical protein